MEIYFSSKGIVKMLMGRTLASNPFAVLGVENGL